jgi:hypothetical protein
MLSFTKTVHLLALGLWFGSSVFFSLIAAPIIFESFQSLANLDNPNRPAWLPWSFQKEQGTQLAGLAVGPIFPWYFLLEGLCGLLALATAWSWLGLEPGARRRDRIRFLILVLAMMTVVAGWPVAQKVSDLRAARYAADTAVAAAANASFAGWHVVSLLLNLVTVGLVTVAMGLATHLPAGRSMLGQQTVRSAASAGS